MSWAGLGGRVLSRGCAIWQAKPARSSRVLIVSFWLSASRYNTPRWPVVLVGEGGVKVPTPTVVGALVSCTRLLACLTPFPLPFSYLYNSLYVCLICPRRYPLVCLLIQNTITLQDSSRGTGLLPASLLLLHRLLCTLLLIKAPPPPSTNTYQTICSQETCLLARARNIVLRL